MSGILIKMLLLFGMMAMTLGTQSCRTEWEEECWDLPTQQCSKVKRQVPSSDYERVCYTEDSVECSTVYDIKNTEIPVETCTTPEKVCHKQQRLNCTLVATPKIYTTPVEFCEDVTTQDCKTVEVDDCTQEMEERCTNKEVTECSNVPETKCTPKEFTNCMSYTEEVCESRAPRAVCRKQRTRMCEDLPQQKCKSVIRTVTKAKFDNECQMVQTNVCTTQFKNVCGSHDQRKCYEEREKVCQSTSETSCYDQPLCESTVEQVCEETKEHCIYQKVKECKEVLRPFCQEMHRKYWCFTAPQQECTFNITRTCSSDHALLPVQQCAAINKEVCKQNLICEEERSEVCSSTSKEKKREICLKVPFKSCRNETIEDCRLTPTAYPDIVKDQECTTVMVPHCKLVELDVCSNTDLLEPEDFCHTIQKEKCEDMTEDECVEEEVEVCAQVPVSTCIKVPSKKCNSRPETVCKENTVHNCTIKHIQYTKYVQKEKCETAHIDVCVQPARTCSTSNEQISTQVPRQDCQTVPKKTCYNQEIKRYSETDECASVTQRKCAQVSRKSCRMSD